MKMAYGVNFRPTIEGTIELSFPDFPEIFSECPGSDRVTLNCLAQDALIAALKGIISTRRPIPESSCLDKCDTVISVPLLATLKLLLYWEMHTRGLSNVELARRLGIRETNVRRMLDLDHQSQVFVIEGALAALNKAVEADLELAPFSWAAGNTAAAAALSSGQVEAEPHS